MLDIARPNVKVRALAVVAHEERAAPIQPAVQVHDGGAPAAGRGADAIARLENESSHVDIVPHVSG